MRVRSARGTRKRRAVRIPGSARVAFRFLPGLAVVATLAVCVHGADRPAGTARPPSPVAHPAGSHTAPKPSIRPRSAWLDGTTPAQPPPRYDDKVVAVFLHHTDSPNDYDCADTPRIIRALYTGQTRDRSWDDIGYNFLVDRCGTIYEGRAGGVDRPVTGAHTQGFNHRTAGIAAIGTFTEGTRVPPAMTEAIAALVAWKLGLTGTDPRGGVQLTSSNGHSRYPRGTTAVLPAVAAHKDAFMTRCPGPALIARLPAIRLRAAELQGRTPDGT
ncbi:peptidoglycan recognition protein [Streptomyces actuosus]|uniref:Peptidoglycan recognition protein n=1 Tax=Streptomyces actuosus TaxID=1885 RepID=A0ABS2VW35_STRAS|nr:peptidoglycan recognition protein [Streptomyces actuosus]MBN0047337.1 peptidoglycan recognition protein [Streptomyces actuosus]